MNLLCSWQAHALLRVLSVVPPSCVQLHGHEPRSVRQHDEQAPHLHDPRWPAQPGGAEQGQVPVPGGGHGGQHQQPLSATPRLTHAYKNSTLFTHTGCLPWVMHASDKARICAPVTSRSSWLSGLVLCLSAPLQVIHMPSSQYHLLFHFIYNLVHTIAHNCKHAKPAALTCLAWQASCWQRSCPSGHPP